MRIPALIALALASPLMACNRASDVCVADETVTTARLLLLDHLIGDPRGVDTDLVQRAFDDVVTFELVRFEGEDKSTRTIRCRAQVKSPNSRRLAEIVYVRQPNLGAKGYVYSITLVPATDAVWAPIALDVVARTRSMAAGPSTTVPVPETSSVSRGVAESSSSPRSVTGRNIEGRDEGFLNLELEGSDGVTLAKFKEWASERDGGGVTWQTSETAIRMRLTWKYDDGRRTVVETTFEPAGQGRVRLGETRRDGEALSMQGAREVIDGVTLDMYQRGMTGP